MLPSEFVEVLGEEASRHSQLVCHVRGERSGKPLVSSCSSVANVCVLTMMRRVLACCSETRLLLPQ